VTTPPPPATTIQHVVWIWMENTGYTGIIGQSSAPYLNQLANTYGLATNYFAIGHPSAPNYVAATSGTDGSCCTDDGYHQLSVPSIFSQLPGGQSRSLEESMPSSCDTGDSGTYAIRHNPMPYYLPVIGWDCQNYDVPLNFSAPDISARFTFITPNTCDDMHDCSTQTGDTWLSQEVPNIMGTPQYQSGTTAIFIVWDEDGNGFSDGNRVACVVVSPYTHGIKDGTYYTHYSLLRTAEDLLGLAPLGSAASAAPMEAAFNLG
jgi:phosphatidylinositol-3-phosphatase